MKKVIVIGSGFAGLSAASFMARAGWQVSVIEKHSIPGGRARRFEAQGFTFDMGPSWYWMPDIFERYFTQLGSSVSDQYRLTRLDPSYRIYWPEGYSDIPASSQALAAMLEQWEPGAADSFHSFIKQAGDKYHLAMKRLVFKPGRSLREYMDPEVVRAVFRMQLFTSMRVHIASYFRDARIRQMMEFPTLFLGALPQRTPALYSLMNFADVAGGTWYPEGGIYGVVQAMHRMAERLGVQFRFNETASAIKIKAGLAAEVITNEAAYQADVVIGGADYHFVESSLLPRAYRSYSDRYWNSRVMAPSCLLYYVGVSKKIPGLGHHTLFFDTPFDQHGHEIYTRPQWPENPRFYVGAPSVTDATVAPPGHENLFLLLPVAAGLTGDNGNLREKYFQIMLKRIEQRTGERILDSVIYKRSFSVSDFSREYNAFKGNAYGMANTLRQTAIFRPSCRSRKVGNLFYTGQLTVPGPGVPPSLISGEIVASEVIKAFGQ